jgi:hypothetical protein
LRPHLPSEDLLMSTDAIFSVIVPGGS